MITIIIIFIHIVMHKVTILNSHGIVNTDYLKRINSMNHIEQFRFGLTLVKQKPNSWLLQLLVLEEKS